MQFSPSTAITSEHVRAGFLWSRQIGTAGTLRRGHCQQLAVAMSSLIAVQRPARRDKQVVNSRQAKATALAAHGATIHTAARLL